MNFGRDVLRRFERAFHCIARRIISILTLALALVLCGCAPSERRADLVIINGAEPESLDPAILTGQPDIRVALSMFEGLARFDPLTGKGIPGIAETWKVSSNGLEYTFHLRSNALWSTGERITAHDFVYSWLRALNPYTASD